MVFPPGENVGEEGDWQVERHKLSCTKQHQLPWRLELRSFVPASGQVGFAKHLKGTKESCLALNEVVEIVHVVLYSGLWTSE